MTVLVLGGAGYIGSHAVDQLINKGYETAAVDNLQTGHRKAVHEKARFYHGDIRDKEFLRSVFEKESVTGVLHFAAHSLVGESMKTPLSYFNNNIYGTQITLEVMKEFEVKNIIFSSSAAVYGEPERVPITEEMPTNPKSAYGDTKLIMEKMMKWCDIACGIKYVSLRYFNVAGAKMDGSIGEDHKPETHLVPIILQAALGQREELSIFGNDYNTKDGTCVRDYIHVVDLIDAHILALEYLKNGGDSSIFNLGSSTGFTVMQMAEAAREVTRREIKTKVAERRAGDPSTLIASSDKARNILGWNPKHTSVSEIIGTAWKWHQGHPNGYNDEFN
ncbi:UDP-glucose 4-epimerase GalE [Bacillus sp. ISL-51]|uniref:UDP-glucose 4-epimerase GalE n=1 Tax=Bacteria TaxID=2 RepID=UPI001BEC322E|nr:MULTISPECIES: UDP-glucose 4-epimerase GalE [Bacteria]MBT2573767.1 UDP-glucose 4-epimerase GalE [Bacillus sp. ISL-51]MBT2634902.1 UDP-glucose 4-epimerase GalE [Bacillus sp. ISL-26]MBT2712376.1 UDP-glucose 4-epimerase GalE [Pseudomonas sp. ISL-88]